jgi:hypothetical protein
MSNIMSFNTSVTDSNILGGATEGEIEVDFSKIDKSDKESGSLFEVGGRVYFEAYVANAGIDSHTTNGFFDRDGYKEPMIDSVVDTFLK